nr:hypothetical protein [Halobacillus sp. KGW1]
MTKLVILLTASIKKVGLVAAPGYPDKLGAILENELPDMLAYYVDETADWQVEYKVLSLTGATEDPREVLEATLDEKQEQGWTFAIALTDLPLFHDKKTLIAETLARGCTALISLPGLGAAPMVKRVREAILQLINEMYYGSSDKDREKAEERIQSKDKDKYPELKNKSSTKLMRRRGLELFSPILREAPVEMDSDVDVRFTIRSRVVGLLRLITGMVRANRPWSMFPAFMKVIVLAFTTGAYALVFPTLWKLSDHYSTWRMLLLSVLSILAMIIWIILAHHLWERKKDKENSHLRRLYNTVTFFTLAVSVMLYYALLFLIFLVTVFLLIPKSMLESQLSADVGYMQFFYIAWTATSVSTIIGALGSALENEEVVLSATYGYRQRQRYEQMKEAEENEDKERY